MIIAKNKNGKAVTSRVINPDARAEFPEHGEPLISIEFTRLHFFTGSLDDPENDLDRIYLSEWEAKVLYSKLGAAVKDAHVDD